MEETQAVTTDLTRHDESPLDGSSTEHGLTARAFVLGLLCVVGIAIAGCYSALLRYDLIGTGHLPRAALWPLLIMVGFGALHQMRRFFWIPYCGFLLIYCITLICQAHGHHLSWKSAWVVMVFAILFGVREWLLANRRDENGLATLPVAFMQTFCALHCVAAIVVSRYVAVPWWLWCNGILIGISAEELRIRIVNGKLQKRRPLTVESVLLGVISTAGLVVIVATMGKHLPLSAAMLLLYLLGVHSFVQLIRTRFNLTRTEKLFAYCMILVSCAIPGQQMATYIYLGMLGPVYYATPQNRFQEIYFNYLRPWIVPGKDPNSPIVRWAFEG
ncbi:MAG: hypothetical protein HY318_00940, partial [Armatimonadetes bacterium]|nr:hypothetical protein [Armatimonadota bacterium]